MLGIVRFFHHLFNPHCPDCKLERDEEKVCQNCDTLRTLLEAERREKSQILTELLGKDKPQSLDEKELPKPVAIGGQKFVPWHVKRQILESDKRAEAELLRKEKEQAKEERKDIVDLEKELEI